MRTNENAEEQREEEEGLGSLQNSSHPGDEARRGDRAGTEGGLVGLPKEFGFSGAVKETSEWFRAE